MESLQYRFLKPQETPFLEEMLYEALFVPAGQKAFPKNITEEPDIAKYISNWGAYPFDCAIVATDGQKLLGIIWGRIFPTPVKGYGYVDAHTPEISMAVVRDFRNLGIGTQLLRLIENYYLEKEVNALSLSVDKRNPAKNLYKRLGYQLYSESGTSQTLRKSI